MPTPLIAFTSFCTGDVLLKAGNALEARPYFLRSAAFGYEPAMKKCTDSYGVALPEIGVDVALHYCRILADEHEDPHAAACLGRLYVYGGRGVPKNYEQAVRYLSIAVKGGYSRVFLDSYVSHYQAMKSVPPFVAAPAVEMPQPVAAVASQPAANSAKTSSSLEVLVNLAVGLVEGTVVAEDLLGKEVVPAKPDNGVPQNELMFVSSAPSGESDKKRTAAAAELDMVSPNAKRPRGLAFRMSTNE